MKPHFVVLAALAAASLLAVAQPPSQLPAPWIVAGESPSRYDAGVDADGSQSGTKGSKYLRHVRGKDDSWGTLMQQFSAQDYRGKRVRFSADVMTHDVSNWAGLWMRVDRKEEFSAAFYNSQDKPIKGTTVWTPRSVTLDVADDADVISLGVISEGGGETWLRNLSVQVVGKDVPADEMPHQKGRLNRAPVW